MKRRTSKSMEHQCMLPNQPSPAIENVAESKCVRCIKRNVQIWNNCPRTREKFRSEYDIEQERIKHVQTNPWIIHPCSKFRTFYEFWMIFVLIATAMYYPVYASFPTMNAKTKIQYDLLGYWLLSLLNVFDMVITFRTGYIEGEADVVCDPKKICRRYMRNPWFTLDTLMFIVGPAGEIAKRHYIPKERWTISEICLVYAFKLCRLLRYVRRLGKFVRVSERCVALWQCLLLCWSISHWIACIFFLVSKYRWLHSGDFPKLNKRSWLHNVNISHKSTLASMYILSMYRSTSQLLSVKRKQFYRRNRLWEEYAVEIAIYIFGRFFMGWITVLILEMFLLISRKEREYQETLTEITGYMCRKNVPALMQERVIRYYEYKFNRTVFRESKILDSLSEVLVAQFHLYDVATLIKSVSFFEKLGAGTLERISKHLKSEVFLENDVIIKAGQPGDCMYFILHGTVSVLTPAGEEVCHLQDGGHFGEICLVLKNKLTNATVVAIERCTLYRLDRKVFKTCIKDKRILDNIEQIALIRQAQVDDMMATSKAAKFEIDATVRQ